MTEENAFNFKLDKLKVDAEARKIGAPTLLATRIAMQNLVHPVGERYQEDFQVCLDEVAKFVPELEGLTFLHEGDLNVKVENDYSKVTVFFEARKVTPEEVARLRLQDERITRAMEEAARTQKPIKDNEAVPVST
jgi:hypothetical protein